jgi:alpha-acetolactate decarboxylase
VTLSCEKLLKYCALLATKAMPTRTTDFTMNTSDQLLSSIHKAFTSENTFHSCILIGMGKENSKTAEIFLASVSFHSRFLITL